jgi:hypothetical protein
MDKIMWPAGKPDVKSPAYAAAIDVTIENRKTILKLALTGAATLNLTIDPEILRSSSAGAVLQIEATADGTNRALTLGTGIEAPVITVVANKTHTQGFELSDDGVFKPVGASVQIN